MRRVSRQKPGQFPSMCYDESPMRKAKVRHIMDEKERKLTVRLLKVGYLAILAFGGLIIYLSNFQ